MNLVEIIGWVGSICFAVCAMPQAYYCYKNKNADGTTWGLLSLWFVGEILTLIYIMLTSQQLPLLMNYILNLLSLFVILRYKIFPIRKKS